MPDETPWNNESSKQCECKLCVYSRKVRATIAKRDVDELVAMVEELHNATYNIGFDLDYLQCVMNGTWPSAVEQLEKALERAKNNMVLAKAEQEFKPIK